MDNAKYYEHFDWSKFTDAESNYKVIEALIPEDVHSIIDVGCGNGLITNELGKNYSVLGVDRSVAALAYVTGDKLLSDCDNIAVEDHSFDLALSSELLEHLEDETFNGTIAELKRISKKYVLISVPYEESLSKGMIQCPKCELIYHRSYHMRKFSVDYVAGLFPEHTVMAHSAFGYKVRVYNPGIAKLKQRLTKPHSWIPYYMAPKGQRQTLCPRCEATFEYPYKFNPVAAALDAVNILVTKKIPFHLVVLLKKND